MPKDEFRRDSDGLELSIVRDLDDDRTPPTTGQYDVPLEGEQFGKYMLVGELAVGGMAEIYLGIQKGLQGYLKVVTIKRVLPHLNNSPEFVSMFIDEARLGARLEHPNIVRTYEFGEHDGQYFTVMEYLPGEDVTKILNRAASSEEPVPLNLAVHIILQVCSGLHFAHELTDTEGNALGLVHRDVNPANIIITYSGEVKIIDFGVAKANTNASQTLAGTIKGKLAYMAPEQVLGHPVDRRADVFSAGVVLWELLTTRPLFARENEGATLYAIMNDPIPHVRQFRPDVPRELDAMVARALARQPSERFETCETMQYALESFLGTQPKVDARSVSRSMEMMFGLTRANAKRSIAQTRSLQKNVSLVMKLRTDVRRDLGSKLDAVAQQAAQAEARPVRPVAPANRKLVFAIIGLLLAGMAGVLAFISITGTKSGQPAVKAAARASIKVESTPPGAAIFMGSEPTGLKTPVTLTGIPPGQISLRLELPGHRSSEQTFEVLAGQAATKQFTLTAMMGRLVLSGLPSDAEVWVDGNEKLLGEVITVPAGRHDVRIDIAGTTVINQPVDTLTGDQIWELQGDQLVRRDP